MVKTTYIINGTSNKILMNADMAASRFSIEVNGKEVYSHTVGLCLGAKSIMCCCTLKQDEIAKVVDLSVPGVGDERLKARFVFNNLFRNPSKLFLDGRNVLDSSEEIPDSSLAMSFISFACLLWTIVLFCFILTVLFLPVGLFLFLLLFIAMLVFVAVTLVLNKREYVHEIDMSSASV